MSYDAHTEMALRRTRAMAKGFDEDGAVGHELLGLVRIAMDEAERLDEAKPGESPEIVIPDNAKEALSFEEQMAVTIGSHPDYLGGRLLEWATVDPASRVGWLRERLDNSIEGHAFLLALVRAGGVFKACRAAWPTGLPPEIADRFGNRDEVGNLIEPGTPNSVAAGFAALVQAVGILPMGHPAIGTDAEAACLA